MDSIKVLWMNNGDESLLQYLSDASDCGIAIVTCSTVAECTKEIDNHDNKWDVVMIQEGYKTIIRKRGEKKEIYKLNSNSLTPFFWHSMEENNISCLIVTDNERLNGLTKFTLKNYASGFHLLSRKEELFKAIKKAPETNLRKKYSVICDFCSDSHLVPLLKMLEGNNHIMPATAIPNECRKLLEWIQQNSLFCGKKLPISIKDYLRWPVNKKTKESCETYDELTLNDFSKAVDKTNYVPEYVKRSFHHCCEITQDGSHLLEIDNLLSKGQAPYVNNSLIYNMLNILYWCASHDKNQQ